MLVKRMLRFAVPVVAISAGILVLSGCRGHHCGWKDTPEEKAEHITKKVAKELDLTDEQKVKLDKIKADFLARKTDFQAIHGGFKEMALAQIRSESVDQSKLNQDMEAREGKVKEMRAFMIAEFAEFHGMLTPAQREKLASKMERHCR